MRAFSWSKYKNITFSLTVESSIDIHTAIVYHCTMPKPRHVSRKIPKIDKF